MSNYLTSLSSGQILKAIRLLKKRETLEKKLASINKELSGIEGGSTSSAAEPAAKPAGKRRGRPPGRRPGRPRKVAVAAPVVAKAKPGPKPKAVAVKATRGGRRGAPGKLKTGIISAVKGAGKEGVKVGTLAAKLKVKPANIFSWFYTTGKKIGQIKKVGEARYAWVE